MKRGKDRSIKPWSIKIYQVACGRQRRRMPTNIAYGKNMSARQRINRPSGMNGIKMCCRDKNIIGNPMDSQRLLVIASSRGMEYKK
jgi:hypothetical protein